MEAREMEPGPRWRVTDRGAVPDSHADPTARSYSRARRLLDDPPVVVVAGPAGAGRRELLAALVHSTPSLLRVPEGSYLILGHDKVPRRVAYVPGYPRPHPYPADGLHRPLPRPPRRVEMAYGDSLLRNVGLINTPDTGTLGVAGSRILLDTVLRAGALLFVIGADQLFTSVELDLLTEVAKEPVKVFFAVTSRVQDLGVDPLDRDERFGIEVDAHRATLFVVSALDGAPWQAISSHEHVEALRRMLSNWAIDEALRRASLSPPILPGARRRVAVASGGVSKEWSDLLERRVREASRRIRQHLAIELAHIHLRAVNEIVHGGGVTRLPQVLDWELHALSLRATSECDLAVEHILDELFRCVFGVRPEEGVRQRLLRAVDWGLADHNSGAEDRVFLVTGAAAVATHSGPGVIGALDAYSGGQQVTLFRPLAVALSANCYQHWQAVVGGGASEARSWTQLVLREVELVLRREVSQRFTALRLSLGAVLTDAVRCGKLCA